VWSAALTQRVGAERAEAITTRHEYASTPSSQSARAMDFGNNNIGHVVGVQANSEGGDDTWGWIINRCLQLEDADVLYRRVAFLAFGEDLEQQLGAAPVEREVAELVEAEQVDPAVAGDDLGQLPVVGGLGEFVDQPGGEHVADPVAGLGRGGAERD
jgi:hypothetical protein